MAEICASIVTETIVSLIKKAANLSVRQAHYMYRFNNFVETLAKEKQELIETQQRIKENAEKASRRTETIAAEVQKWLNDAETLMREVGELQKQTDMHGASGWFPNFIQHYRLGRRVAKKIEQLTQLKGNCNFHVFSRLATLQGMEYYSSEGFISFESRKHAYNQIMEALKNEGIHRIGVHGMGGSGKTTLVKEVGKEAEKLRLFEKVLIVVVSNPPNTRKIQTSLAGFLGFKFEVEEDEPERARRLSMALNKGGKILVILDDVWQRLNFEAIGIPNNCYFLLTTRDSTVCNIMDCEKVISLQLLNDTESWILFKEHARISDHDKFHTFKDVGQEIATMCKGLPVAIAAVASSLKVKQLVNWEVARDTLRDPGQGDILEDVYKCLKLSYDSLKGEGVKSLFLLCSLFPVDDDIIVELFTRTVMGLGFFGNINSNEKTRNQVSVAINKLMDSCLLMKGVGRDTIKMHDLVHDVTLKIEKMEDKMIIGIKGNKKDLEEYLISKDSQIRYVLWDEDEFPNQLNCPKLEYLDILTNIENQVAVPNEFFNQMKDLRVLNLNNYLYKDPILQRSMSIQSLTNLRCLALGGWQLGDISFVGSLVKIETVMLYNSLFHELPNGIANLKNLRLLDLLECQIERNPYEVIKRCSQLEELYFIRNEYPKWGDKGENRVDFSSKLQRYHIEVGSNFENFDDTDYSIKRYLSLEDLDNLFSTATIDHLIRRAEVLSLGGIHRSCTSIIPSFVQKIGEGMNELAKFIVHHSDELVCVVDLTKSFYQDEAVFSNLTHLKISQLQKLESFFLGQPHHDIFPKLEELHISECNQLKHLIANETREIVSDGDNLLFPKLKLIIIIECQELEYLMPTSFAQGLLKLENLNIKGASQLKYLFSQSNLEDEGQISNQNQNVFHIIKLEALKSLTLEHMRNIISICSENCFPVWPCLDSLLLMDCPLLKIMIGNSKFRQRYHTFTKNEIFCNLTELYFSGLDCLETLFVDTLYLGGFEKLEKISILRCNHLKHLIANDVEKTISDVNNPWSYNSFFPKLKEITIKYCQELEYLIPISFIMGLLQLEEVDIDDASQLKYVFGPSSHKAEDNLVNQNLTEANIIKLEALKSLSLCDLPNIISICPENYYPVWPSLDSLLLRDCPLLKIMIGNLEFKQRGHTFTKNEIFCNLTVLHFIGLDCLETLFVDTLYLGGFEKLEKISILRCNHLKHLIANDVEKTISDVNNPWSYNSVFPKLKEITIKYCQELEYLFPISFIMGLLQLEEVDIDDASQLKYVFGPSNHKAEDNLVNQNLNEANIIKLEAVKSLSLSDLPNIISICPENYYPIWPSLDSLKLRRCPRLNIKPIINCLVDLELRQQYHTITKELGAAMISCVQNLKSLSFIKNNEVDGLFHLEGLPTDGQQIIAGLTVLDLYHISALKYIWSGPKQFLSLQKLQRLKIKNCTKLEVVFSTSILRSLNQLKKLLIIKCQELHQIFELEVENKDQSNPYSGDVCLPKLTALTVQQCNKLKYLFSIATSFELPKLKFLIIKEASELEVITCEKADKTEQMQVKFLELEHVVLVQLPKLREVYRGIELETVRHRVVYHCPKLSLMSSATLESFNVMYKKYYWNAPFGSDENTAIRKIRDILKAESEIELHSSKVDPNLATEAQNTSHLVIPLHTTTSVSIKEKGQESDQENPKSKEIVTAPLSVHLEASNKGRAEDSPTFDDVSLTHAKSKRSPQPQATSTSFSWLKEKEDHNEGLGNDSKNKHHHENFDSLTELSTTMPEAQCKAVQSEDKSCDWGKFLTLSLLSGPQMVEQSPPEKTTSHHIVPEKLDSEVKQILEETANKIAEKSPLLAKSEEKASSIELVQNMPMNEPLSAAEEQALQQNEVSTSCQLSFSARVPPPIPIPSPNSRYFSNTSNAEGDILGGLDLNKPPKEFFEAIEQSSTPGPLVLQNPSFQGQNRISQTKTYNREDTKGEPIINQAFEGTDLVDLFQSMEDDDEVEASMPSTSVISANNPDMEIKSMAKALADLQISLKMPLENIASSEAESLPLENALNFLSSNSCADGAMPDGLKAAIDSLHQEFHNILSSFKQASATILRFTVLEEKEKTIKEELPRRKESTIALMNEIQQKEVSVMEQISKLQDELSLLQEQKKKCVADTLRFKSEFESVKNNKAQMLEDHIKCREELFKVDYKWSNLCSQFVDKLSSARNLS